MQNKGAIWLFTILLALACLFQISFSFFTNSFENKAEEEAAYLVDSVRSANGELTTVEEENLKEEFKNDYLVDNSNEEIYPVFGYTYQECKERQINLGLDLAGGMSVTLEVSIPDLIVNLSNNVRNEQLQDVISKAKQKQRDSQSDFVTLFGETWEENYPESRMANIFHSRDNKDRFPRDATNSEILNILREEAQVAINNTEKILRTRIDKFGVTQPTIQKQQFTGRILVELPGVKDKERVRKQLKSTANLEFWNTYENSEVFQYIDQANSALSEYYYPEDTLESEEPLSAEELLEQEEQVQDEGADADVEAESDADTSDVSDEDLLLGETESESDTAAAEIESEISDAERQRQFPLFSKLSPNITGNNQIGQGPVVGFASLADTADVNDMLREEVVQDILPDELRLLWSAEPDTRNNNVMRLYAIKVDTRDGKAPLDGSVIVDASQQYDVAGNVEDRKSVV